MNQDVTLLPQLRHSFITQIVQWIAHISQHFLSGCVCQVCKRPHERSVACYSGFMDKKITSSSSSEPTLPSFQELAVQQGVVPVEEFDDLLGRPAPGDESAEEFAVKLREWRREGTDALSTQ